METAMVENVIPLHKPPTPDPDCHFVDEHGVEWFRFACEYAFEGSEWNVEVMATSAEDAAARLRAIGGAGIVKGRLFAKIAAQGDVTVEAIVRAGGVMAPNVSASAPSEENT